MGQIGFSQIGDLLNGLDAAPQCQGLQRCVVSLEH